MFFFLQNLLYETILLRKVVFIKRKQNKFLFVYIFCKTTFNYRTFCKIIGNLSVYYYIAKFGNLLKIVKYLVIYWIFSFFYRKFYKICFFIGNFAKFDNLYAILLYFVISRKLFKICFFVGNIAKFGNLLDIFLFIENFSKHVCLWEICTKFAQNLLANKKFSKI